jgi:hypothetical protein
MMMIVVTDEFSSRVVVVRRTVVGVSEMALVITSSVIRVTVSSASDVSSSQSVVNMVVTSTMTVLTPQGPCSSGSMLGSAVTVTVTSTVVVETTTGGRGQSMATTSSVTDET